MFKVLLTINAILAFVSGSACALIPEQLLAQYDVRLSPMGLVIYQFWGVALIGLGMLIWFVRSITDFSLQKRIALALLITNALSIAIAIRGQFSGANSSGWSTVVLFLLLTLCWGVFMFIKPQTANSPYECHNIP